MKRLLYHILCVGLFASLVPMFAACDADKPETPESAPLGTQAPTAAPTEAPTQAPTDIPTQAPTDAPTETAPREELSYRDSLIVAKSGKLRDPCVLLHDGKYYMYGTGWTYCVSDSLTGQFSEPKSCVEIPADCAADQWAPEVHEYKGKFYMFTTYRSSKNGHRGCAIFVADQPEGPFKLHSDGHVTPADWDAIDGTFYVDKDGQPWMVFVHEWTSTDDGVGRMACAKLSDDLTHFVSEPVELFRADDPKWSRAHITDGCYMYMTRSGELLMIWSNWDRAGYCVGIARSESGDILGPWTQDSDLLYSKKYTRQYDGGHGMIFTDTEGRLWMSLHSPNDASTGRVETPVFIPLVEKDGTLCWDLYKRD